MATLTRSITNASSVNPVVLAVPGFDPTSKLTIAASATVDLFTVMSADALHAMQAQLAELVASGELTVAGTIDSTELYQGAILNWISSSDTQVVFNPTSASASHTTGAASVLQIENASGAIDVFDNATTITVAATGGTSPLINGHASPITFTANKGTASVLVTDSASGTVTLSISSVSRTLTHSSTFVATLS